MEQTQSTHRWRPYVLLGGAALLAVLLRRLLMALALQLAAAGLLMAMALPLCRALERRLPSGVAAAAALLALGAGGLAALAVLLPPLMTQLQQLTAALPDLLDWAQARWAQLSAFLAGHGLDMTRLQSSLFTRLTELFGGLISRWAAAASQLAASLGKVLIAPLLAFYLLRDRRSIAAALTLLLPVKHRARGVRAAREMRRETTAYLRGQLLLCLMVGGLTALGLALTGTPGYLLLGVLMGVMELVPYVGPVAAGLPAVLLSLQNGWVQALWTLAALLLIQQLEGAVLSPRLLAGATQLHPMVVLLLVSAGGIAAGPVGMVLVIPLTAAIRGALRGWRT